MLLRENDVPMLEVLSTPKSRFYKKNQCSLSLAPIHVGEVPKSKTHIAVKLADGLHASEERYVMHILFS